MSCIIQDSDFIEYLRLKQRKNNKTQIEKIDKLRYFGLNDEQIAEVLELPLEVIKQVESNNLAIVVYTY
ncbi:hypothetical protein [Dolichospermum sp. LEGE 00246]|uniref:hypothetical protein n=1 Tax=Dolichospermum sp. LEGE 00246 TaxID=1828605 RepID=UPI00188297BC|nr:hypothetical protein [Dolichospermum sp. LEGE 00246]MBE9260174.1 hypothetical protein [Dolichospermum sp. LEGE 00246]